MSDVTKLIHERDIQKTIRAFNWLIGHKRLVSRFDEVPALERQKIKVVDALRKIMYQQEMGVNK
jgi:hypothetical protein